MNIKNREYSLKSRNLGSEWENWDEIIKSNEKLNTKSSLFLVLMTISTFIIIGIPSSVFYSLSLQHNFFLFWIFFSFLLIVSISYVMVMLTIWLEKPIAFFLKDKRYSNTLIVKFTLFLGTQLGFSQDRLLNSLLQVGNSLTRTLYTPVNKDEILILTPRCLSKPIRQELHKLASDKGISYKIAAGGSEARDILKEFKPKAIIAVACERDLFAGVKDVPSQIPVIAISNERPEGPCRNTTIRIDDLNEAINFFNKRTD